MTDCRHSADNISTLNNSTGSRSISLSLCSSILYLVYKSHADKIVMYDIKSDDEREMMLSTVFKKVYPLFVCVCVCVCVL